MNASTAKEVNKQEKTTEFEFTDSDFNRLRELVSSHTGICLAEHKRDLVYGRLARRLRALGLNRFDDYIRLLKENPDHELENFTNAITTNLTAFFRENHHFEHLEQQVVPQLIERYRANGRVRIWSAGCSTGEEPYSIAMILSECIPDIQKRDIRILATDLDSNVVNTASQGIYLENRITNLSSARKKRWFKQGSGANKGKVQVSPALRQIITFRQLNLMHPWPMSGLFDVIFCRNVVIYFDKPTQRVLFDRYAEKMLPDSTLFIGHSENLNNVSDRFKLIGKTIYRKLR